MSCEDLKFVGGRLCLDFVNTVDAWAGPPAGAQMRPYGDTALREKIVDYGALVRWGQLSSAISAQDANRLIKGYASHGPEASASLARALRLRRALYRIFKSLVQRWEPERIDTDILHQELALAREHEWLIHRDGIFLWTWDQPTDALDCMLWPVARSAVDLLTSADLRRLRQCKGDECGWMFLDISRNRSRQWCDMNDCGNLDKVRRFRRRHAVAK